MKQFFSILLVFLLSMCKSSENLILPKESFIGANLKTDGYFYFFSNKNAGYGYDGKIFNSFILYRNGIFYNVGSGHYDDNLSIEANLKLLDSNVIRRTEDEKEYINTHIGWGVFKVQGSEIKVERWLSGNGGAYPTQTLIGKIKNDTTIHFHTQIGNNYNTGGKKKTYEIDETYRFRQFSPKPDSANVFIK